LLRRGYSIGPFQSAVPAKGERAASWHWFALKGDEPRLLFATPGV
jgi:hypothetical protein